MVEENRNQNQNQDANKSGEQQNQMDLSKMDQKLDAIAKSVQAGQKLTQQDEDVLAALLAEDDGNKGGEKKEALEKSRQAFEDQDFDSMSNSNMVASIMKRIGQEIQTQFGGLKDHFDGRLNQATLESAQANLGQEIKELKSEHGEAFVKSYDETLKIAEQNPNLTLRQAFMLATSSGVRGDLKKLTDAQKKVDNKAAGVSLLDSVTDSALQESLKGEKTHADVARKIAAQIGLE